MELGCVGVLTTNKVGLDGREVLWLLDDLEVVRDIVRLWVDRSAKGLGILMSLQEIEYMKALCKFVFRIDVNAGAFRYLGHLVLKILVHLLCADTLVSPFDLFSIFSIAR